MKSDDCLICQELSADPCTPVPLYPRSDLVGAGQGEPPVSWRWIGAGLVLVGAGQGEPTGWLALVTLGWRRLPLVGDGCRWLLPLVNVCRWLT